MPQRKQPPRWNFTAHVSRATTSPLLARSRSLSPLLRGRKEVKKICKKCIPHAAVSRFELKIFPRLGNDGGNREKVPMPLPFPSLLSWSLHPVAGSFRSQFPTASQRRQEGEKRGDLLLYNTQLPQQQLLPFAHKRDRASERTS